MTGLSLELLDLFRENLGNECGRSEPSPRSDAGPHAAQEKRGMGRWEFERAQERQSFPGCGG